MKRFIILALVITLFTICGCKKGNEGGFERSTTAGGPFFGADSVISGNITTSRTLSPDKVYKLDGIVFVSGGAKLTILPGTVITTGATVNYRTSPTAPVRAIAGVLVITRTGSIDALGEADAPIIFTTPKLSTERVAGDFGGVVILGESLTNKPFSYLFDGLPRFDAEGNSLNVDLSFGGSVSGDNSGVFKFVRIDYAGYRLATEQGIGGLTLAGVGSATTIDHIQVSCSADDGFAFLGGTVNAKYLIALANNDDDYDFDLGYSGSIQYAISLKDPSSTHRTSGASAVSDSNGIESDNDNVNGNVATPRTKPNLSNFTILGYATAGTSTLRAGNRWRRNTDLLMTNSIIAGYNTGAEFQDGTLTGATSGGFTGNVVHAFTTVFSSGTAASLMGSDNTISTSSDPASFIALGYNGFANLNPFYTTAVRASYRINNLRPRVSTSTKGAVLTSNLSQWVGYWVYFNPQDSQD